MTESRCQRLPIVGVMGSGSDIHAELAEPLGRWLAGEGVHLLTGGGAGVMEAVSRAFCQAPERRGLVIGVIPSASQDPGDGPRAGYPNAWVELPLYTHLHRSGADGRDLLSRNHINILSSDAVVVLPGGQGTLGEVALALRYGRPLVALATAREDWPGLPAEVELATSLEAVRDFVRRALGKRQRERGRGARGG